MHETVAQSSIPAAGLLLQILYLPPYAGKLQICSYMLAICHRGYPEIRAGERKPAGC